MLIFYFLSPKRLKNSVLLLSSLFFYAWGEPSYVFLMLFAILCGYVSGLLIEKYRGRRPAKLFLILSLLLSAGILGFFKYADFFLENFNAVTGLSVPLLKIALPIGISFYTFQLISYTVDVYRGGAAQKKPGFSINGAPFRGRGRESARVPQENGLGTRTQGIFVL